MVYKLLLSSARDSLSSHCCRVVWSMLPDACLATISLNVDSSTRFAWASRLSHRSVHSGAVLAFGCLLGFEPNGWLLVGMASGMTSVKVHEWFLVCYVWLAAALATTSMLSYLFSYAARLVSS